MRKSCITKLIDKYQNTGDQMDEFFQQIFFSMPNVNIGQNLIVPSSIHAHSTKAVQS
jgi:hypothetical protein